MTKDQKSALFARAQAGDRAALQRLIALERPALTRFATAFASVESDAEDIVQEAMIRATDAIDTVREASSLSSWLFRLTRNAGIDWYRRKRNREFSEVFDDEEPITQTGRELQPDVLASRRDDVALLHAAIQEFPHHYRIPLILCELDGMSYEEVAAIEKIPVGTVRSRLSRARKMLAELLRDVQRLEQEFERQRSSPES